MNITAKIIDERTRNYTAFKKEEHNLAKGQWVTFQDGRFFQSGTTEQEAVKGLSLGYFCGLVGYDPTKVDMFSPIESHVK